MNAVLMRFALIYVCQAGYRQTDIARQIPIALKALPSYVNHLPFSIQLPLRRLLLLSCILH